MKPFQGLAGGSIPSQRINKFIFIIISYTGLAQSVERQPFKLVVEGSSPSFGDFIILFLFEK
jgi:hypothetical protein